MTKGSRKPPDTLKANVISGHSSRPQAANECVDHWTRMRRYSGVRVDRPRYSETTHRSSAPASARLSDFRCLAFARGERLLPSRQVPRRSRPRKKYIDGRRQCRVGSFSFFLLAPPLPSSRLVCHPAPTVRRAP